MAAIKYKLELTEAERSRLNEVSQRGKASVRTVKRALSLLKADQGLRDREIADVLLVNAATVARARKRYGRQAGRQAGSAPDRLRVQRRARRAHALDTPVVGRQGWSWSLPRAWRRCARYSKKRTQVPAKKKEWCIPKVSDRMEACWTCTNRSTIRSCPVVCFDETSRQLTGEVVRPSRLPPDGWQRYDTEYQRNERGTCS